MASVLNDTTVTTTTTAAISTPTHKRPIVTEESLSAHQLKSIEALRQRLGDTLLQQTPIFNDTFSLLRWLHGGNYKVEEVAVKFEKASRTLQLMGAVDLVIEDLNEMNAFVAQYTSAANYFPGGVMGVDREGNVTNSQYVALTYPKQLALCGRTSDIYRLTIMETALLYQLVR